MVLDFLLWILVPNQFGVQLQCGRVVAQRTNDVSIGASVAIGVWMHLTELFRLGR